MRRGSSPAGGTDYTPDFLEIAAAAATLRAKTAVLDGEVVVVDERSRSRFQLLQRLAASRRGLAYFAFDLLALHGEDLTPLPLEERKRRTFAIWNRVSLGYLRRAIDPRLRKLAR